MPPPVLSIDVGRKNLGLCLLEAGACPKGGHDQILEWIVTASEPTPKGIAACLDALPWVLRCGEVVVERQPNRNPTMTRLQHYLEMYFVMHGRPVTVQDAKHKLAFAAATPWWDADLADNWSYRTRKKLSVATCRKMLDETGQSDAMRHVFHGSTKKDDLADSLLQGMAFCHNVLPLELTKRGMAAGTGAGRVKPRRPTDKQLSSGKLSKPNIAYYLKACKAPRDIAAAAARHKHLEKSIQRLYGGLEAPDLLASLGLGNAAPGEEEAAP